MNRTGERQQRNTARAFRRRFVRLIGVFALVVPLGGIVSGTQASARPHDAGPADAFVAAWDAIGTQAFSAAALTPAEGHTIFAYVAIAVYDSVIAVEGGYEPFAVDVDAPAGASAQAAVAAAAHRVLVHYLPAQAATIVEPALRSKQWAREYNEVKQIGSSTSTTRTAEQTLAARFWAEAPVQQARGGFRKFVLDHDLDVVEAARFMAMISVTYADALIACFEAKYHYAFWRPITAIRAGDTDNNAATAGDPTWAPLLAATPNHPDYPSAHSCLTPAGGRVIADFLGTKQIDYTVPSLTGLGDRHFATPKDLEFEVGNARIWGGIHFRSAVEDGVKLGKQVADHVLDHNFHKSDD